MICSLTGLVTFQGDGFVCVEAQGVGYEVILPAAVAMGMRGTQTFYTHEVVRDTARELFGFTSREGWELARQLVNVPGVGLRLAQRIVYGGSTAQAVVEKIEGGDVPFLSSISGVGKKTAQKIILELQGKLVDIEPSRVHHDAFGALLGLGYARTEVEEVLRSLSQDVTETEALIRESLRLLGKK